MPPTTRFSWRHQYDEGADKVNRVATDVENDEPTKTQQQFKDEVDLNVMMKRMGVTGKDMPAAPQDPRFYGDFTSTFDFRDSLDKTREAADRFNALPAEIRRKFDNNPLYLHDWIMDTTNHEQAVELGLLKKRTPEPPPPVTAPPAVP